MKNIITLFLIFSLNMTFSQAGSQDMTFNPSDIGYGNGISGSSKSINKIEHLANGKILMVGIFDSFLGISRNNIIRLNADGTLDSTFNAGTGATGSSSSIHSFAVLNDGKILIVGNFTGYNGISIIDIARLNVDGSLDTTFNSGTGSNLSIKNLTVQTDGKILIFGEFSSYNGSARNRIARLNADGSLDSTFDTGIGLNNSIFSVTVQTDGKYIITGYFTFYNNISRNGVALLNTDGTLDTITNIGIGPCIGIENLLKMPNGKILIAGGFTSYNGTLINRIARLNSNGTVDSSFSMGTGANNNIDCVTLQTDGKILIGGRFTAYNGTSRSGIARLNNDGTLDTNFDPGSGITSPTNNINSIAVATDDKIVIGGTFRTYHGITRNYLAQLNTNGSLNLAFTSGTSAGSVIKSIGIQVDGKIIIGGNFPSYNDIPVNRIARLTANGNLDSSFNSGSGVNGLSNSIIVQLDGKILIGGFFTDYNGSTRNNIARLNTNGSLDPTFNLGSGADSSIETIALQADGKIVIGGLFTSYNGTTINRIARLNTDGTLDPTFNVGMGANNAVYSIVVQPDGKILIGGLFTNYNGTSINRIIRLNANGTLDSSFSIGTGTNNTIFSIALQTDGKILLGGNFTTFNGISRIRLARINSDGSLDTSFNVGTGANQSVRTVVLTSGGKILVGGSFTSFNGSIQTALIQLNNDGTTDTDFQNGTGTSGSIYALSLQNDGKLLVGGDFQSYNQMGRNHIARIQTTESTLGIKKNIRQSTSVYPNPSNGIFTINAKQNFENTIISVANLNGRIVYEAKSENLDNIIIDLNHLQNGIYILTISNENNNYSQKIIKQ